MLGGGGGWKREGDGGGVYRMKDLIDNSNLFR